METSYSNAFPGKKDVGFLFQGEKCLYSSPDVGNSKSWFLTVTHYGWINNTPLWRPLILYFAFAYTNIFQSCIYKHKQITSEYYFTIFKTGSFRFNLKLNKQTHSLKAITRRTICFQVFYWMCFIRCTPINLLVIYAKATGKRPKGIISGGPWGLVSIAYCRHCFQALCSDLGERHWILKPGSPGSKIWIIAFLLCVRRQAQQTQPAWIFLSM